MLALIKAISMTLVFHSTTMASPPKYVSGGESFRFEVLAQQKDVVWGFDFLDGERMIFTERDGALRVLNLVTKAVSDVKGAPRVRAAGQGGLLDVRVHPVNRSTVYLSYSEPTKDGATTAVGLATLKGDQLVNFRKIFSAHESNDNKIHYGSRIEFDGRGHIFISIGDRDERDRAQMLTYHSGKIIRLKEDGQSPRDNPFVLNKQSKPEVWSYGHRNPQGLARNSENDELWSTEMGPRGGDELNLIRKGANYGWPVITYGREYYGPKIGEGAKKDGMEQPVAYWVPSISPSAMTFYSGTVFSKWQGDIFIGNLSGAHIRRIKIKNNKVIEQHELLKNLGLRFRNLRTGPDGFLYLSTDDGKIARLVR